MPMRALIHSDGEISDFHPVIPAKAGIRKAADVVAAARARYVGAP